MKHLLRRFSCVLVLGIPSGALAASCYEVRSTPPERLRIQDLFPVRKSVLPWGQLVRTDFVHGGAHAVPLAGYPAPTDQLFSFDPYPARLADGTLIFAHSTRSPWNGLKYVPETLGEVWVVNSAGKRIRMLPGWKGLSNFSVSTSTDGRRAWALGGDGRLVTFGSGGRVLSETRLDGEFTTSPVELPSGGLAAVSTQGILHVVSKSGRVRKVSLDRPRWNGTLDQPNYAGDPVPMRNGFVTLPSNRQLDFLGSSGNRVGTYRPSGSLHGSYVATSEGDLLVTRRDGDRIFVDRVSPRGEVTRTVDSQCGKGAIGAVQGQRGQVVLACSDGKLSLIDSRGRVRQVQPQGMVAILDNVRVREDGSMLVWGIGSKEYRLVSLDAQGAERFNVPFGDTRLPKSAPTTAMVLEDSSQGRTIVYDSNGSILFIDRKGKVIARHALKTGAGVASFTVNRMYLDAKGRVIVQAEGLPPTRLELVKRSKCDPAEPVAPGVAAPEPRAVPAS